jgi:hypothetical protein
MKEEIFQFVPDLPKNCTLSADTAQSVLEWINENSYLPFGWI